MEWVVQDIPVLGRSTLAYEYDLISNKVLKVKMNENRNDAFFHKYSYDEDNRIKEAFTSANGFIWDKDASYSYFDHGPLKNIQLGQDKIQNIQYTYTLNGWLKAINTPDLSELTTGEDAGFGHDKFGMVLGYYDGDFSRSSGTRFTGSDPLRLGASLNGATKRNLYNGNISSWLTSGISTDGSADKLTGYQYTYDKLNRIKGADFNTYNTGTSMFGSTSLFKETYNYDLNGNILGLTRNGNNTATLEMDNLTYNYISGTNKLSHVADDPTFTNRYTMDVDNQPAGNYSYDEIGNLTRDAQAGNSIIWNVYGKVSEVRPDKAAIVANQRPHITYSYDAAGNRIRKQTNYKPVYDAGGNLTNTITNPDAVTTTFYVRDASGNTMAVYERSNLKDGDHYRAIFTLLEVPIYGSDRLGMYKPSITEKLADIPFMAADFDKVKLDLGMLMASLPGTQTFVAASQNGESAVINQALYNKAANYYSFTENWLNFTGSITGNVAVAENENGDAQFYVVPAYTNAPVLMVYNNNKTLMTNSDALAFDPAKQVQVARLLGSAASEYLLFTVGADGKLYYHKAGMTLNSGLGGFSVKNQVLDNVNSDYNGQLLAIEDQTTGNVKLLATRLTGTTLHLVKYELTSALSGALSATELITLNNSYGAANMKLSPDGKKLLLYHFTGTGILGVKPAELLVYNLAGNYQMADANGVVFAGDPIAVPVSARTALPDGTTANSSGEFNATGNSIIYNQVTTTASNINAFNMTDGGVQTLLANTTGDISLRSDGRLYISPAGSNNLLAYEQDLSTSYPVAMTTTLTGAMAGKVYKAHSSNITEQTFARLTGLKQYELKDHLGNVRSVVSDLLTAQKNAGNVLVNDANVLSYFNYYPFGMQMPGRYGPSSLVGQGGYRYGFNGKEKDDDISGSTGAVYDYGFRIYDARIAKFLSVDPLTKKYPELTPFQFASNTPIQAIDLDGLEAFRPIGISMMATQLRDAKKYSNNGSSPIGAFMKGTVSAYTKHFSPLILAAGGGLVAGEMALWSGASLGALPAIQTYTASAVSASIGLRLTAFGADAGGQFLANSISSGSLREGFSSINWSVPALNIINPTTSLFNGISGNSLQVSAGKGFQIGTPSQIIAGSLTEWAGGAVGGQMMESWFKSSFYKAELSKIFSLNTIGTSAAIQAASRQATFLAGSTFGLGTLSEIGENLTGNSLQNTPLFKGFDKSMSEASSKLQKIVKDAIK